MVYKLLEHEADIGVQGIGKTVEKAFEQGAVGLFEVMVDTKTIAPKEHVDVDCEAHDIEALYVEWLNNLLAKKDLDNLFFSKFEVKIEKKGNRYILKGKAYGEPLDLNKHHIRTEAKGATYSGLKYEQKQGKHIVQCIVDI